MVRQLLVILCCFLVVAAARPAAATPRLSTGLGVASTCGTVSEGSETISGSGISGSDRRDRRFCGSGPRGEALFDFLHKESGSGGGDGDSDRVSVSGDSRRSGGSFSLPGNTFSGVGNAREAVFVILVILLVIIVVYGLIAGLAALASSEMSAGLYYSQDYYARAIVEDDGDELPGMVRRYGVQVGFWIFDNFPMRMHVGAGPASLEAGGAGDGEKYREGFSSKFGLGLVPRPGNSGPFIFAEWEHMVLRSHTFRELVSNSDPTRKPENRLSSAGVAGYSFAF